MTDKVRCPECIDGPIPGAIYDYSHPSEMKWEECPACQGTGLCTPITEGEQGER